MRFSSLPPGTVFNRKDSHGGSDKCIKLHTPFREWNCVYLDGKFAGGFCSTDDDKEIEPSHAEDLLDKEYQELAKMCEQYSLQELIKMCGQYSLQVVELRQRIVFLENNLRLARKAAVEGEHCTVITEIIDTALSI